LSERSVVIIGLPESGKTTYLAALWHVVTAQDVETLLTLTNPLSGDRTYLNEIAKHWRDAVKQERTLLVGSKTVSMNLKDAAGTALRVTFPDVPGEEYRKMWEERECDPVILEFLLVGGVLLFIHADTIKFPTWLLDEIAFNERMGIEHSANESMPWAASMAPTQVQLVDLLQLLRSSPIDIGPRKVAVMLSAWDKTEPEGLSPEAFLAEKLPLLDQYLRRGADGWDWSVYGVSAQGGDYDSADPKAEKVAEAAELRKRDNASTRVKVVRGNNASHDLTEPLAWLMQ
jgi:hypothetical protein